MSTLAQALVVLLPTLYVTAAFLYGQPFSSIESTALRLPRRIVMVLLLALHLLFFVVQGQRFSAFPTFEAWSTLSMVTLAVILLFLFTSRRESHRGVGAVILGVCALLQIGASSFGPIHPSGPHPHSGFFYLFHALTSVAAAAALILSGIYGGLYLIVYRRMRNRQIDTFIRGMPSMRALGSLTRRAALAGFLLLTIGLNVGIGWAHANDIADFRYSDPWVLALIILWLHFGLVSFSHRIPGFSARRASFAAAAGLTILLTVGVLTLIPEFSFHWDAKP